MPVDQPIICPILIGRAADLTAVEHALAETAAGRGQTMLVAGEAGIGKSRLVAETKGLARRRGFAVLQGHCFESDRSLPFGPLIDLLRGQLTGDNPAEFAANLGASGPEVVKLLPDLTTLVPGLVPSAPLEPEQEKRRLFHTLARLLHDRAAERPALVVIEDLHWSDETSLDFLLAYARGLAARSILLLLTYRPDDASPGLNHLLALLDRERLARELILTPLTPPEIDAMLRAMFGLTQPVRREFLESIAELSQGNPFAVEELLKALVAAGDVVFADGNWTRKPIARLHLPRTVQDAVRQRCARLGDEARSLLNLAAVAGHRFDFAILQRVTGHAEADLLESIKELVAAQLVVEETADRFAFRHALTRQAIAADLLARERRVLHRRIAEAIEATATDTPEAHLGDLATHFTEAEDWEKAHDFATRAGRRALALFAPRAAVEHLTRAIDTADRLHRPPPARLLRERGQAYGTLGDFTSALRDGEHALALAERMGDRTETWQTLIDLGFLWAARDYGHALAYFERALALAHELDDPVTVAHSLNRMGNWYANQEQPEPARRYHQEALAIFERLGDRRGIAESLDLLGMAVALGGDVAGARPSSERAAALFEELGDQQGLAGTLSTMAAVFITHYESDTLPSLGEAGEAVRLNERGLALAREIGWRAGESYAQALLGECLAAVGEYASALDLLHQALITAEEIDHQQWMIQTLWGRGRLHADLMALAAAWSDLERARSLAATIRSPSWLNFATAGLTAVLIAQGDLPQAETALATVLTQATPMQTLGQRQLWCARAELALARREPAVAREIVDGLYAAMPNPASEGDVPRLAHVKARALTLLGELTTAEALLLTAQATARAHGALPSLWRLHAALGEVYHQQGRREEGERETAAARDLVERLTRNTPEGALREGFARAAMRELTGTFPTPARRAGREAAGGLTPRERQVAILLAEGRTNRDIADTLFVSERTVEAHVGNILLKLGANSRTQVATWAVEHGLTGTT